MISPHPFALYKEKASHDASKPLIGRGLGWFLSWWPCDGCLSTIWMAGSSWCRWQWLLSSLLLEATFPTGHQTGTPDLLILVSDQYYTQHSFATFTSSDGERASVLQIESLKSLTPSLEVKSYREPNPGVWGGSQDSCSMVPGLNLEVLCRTLLHR